VKGLKNAGGDLLLWHLVRHLDMDVIQRWRS
jgi:hypothetical protein